MFQQALSFIFHNTLMQASVQDGLVISDTRTFSYSSLKILGYFMCQAIGAENNMHSLGSSRGGGRVIVWLGELLKVTQKAEWKLRRVTLWVWEGVSARREKCLRYN
jgi:hypothetical protein